MRIFSKSSLRNLAGTLTLAAGSLVISSPSYAAYPEQTITIVVPFAPGGPTDTSARLFGKVMSEKLGQPIIIENKPGAGGTVGSGYVTRQKPDGYTLLWAGTSSIVVAPALYTNLPYDPLTSFTPIGMAVRGPMILVGSPNLDTKDLPSLLKEASSKEYTYASAGTGSIGHLTGEMLRSAADIKLLHIPYSGGAPALKDVMAGEVNLIFETVGMLYSNIEANKVKAFAITANERYSRLPDLPTVSEILGKPFESYSWFGLMAPTGTPAEITEKLSKAMDAASHDKDIVAQLETMGLEPVVDTPTQFGDSIKTDLEKWKSVVQEANIKVQ